jgi:putative membrane protein
MPNILLLTLWAFFVLPFVSVTGSFGATSDIQSETQSVLNKAAVEVQVEISLGQLAAQRASNREVREFGQQMVEDHKKAGQQVELLALKHGITLSPGEDHEHHKKLEELSRLSGHAFDREYMDYSIRDHESTLEAFQRRAQIVQDQDIKQWISLLLPILEGHREKAHRVKYSLQTNP